MVVNNGVIAEPRFRLLGRLPGTIAGRGLLFLWNFRGPQQPRLENLMQLIAYYVIFMIVGDLAAYVVGLLTEKAFGDQASLIVFLTLYFLFLWVSWLLAVWITEPKTAKSVVAEST
jgi:hypothetical protein